MLVRQLAPRSRAIVLAYVRAGPDATTRSLAVQTQVLWHLDPLTAVILHVRNALLILFLALLAACLWRAHA